MRIIHDLREFRSVSNHGIYCTIGMFDGVHRGHQHILYQTLHRAKKEGGISLAISFDRHPANILFPDQAPEMIYPLSKRIELLDEAGIDFLWLIKFDRCFSKISGREFLDLLIRHFHPIRLICVGPDFHFGHKRSGDISLLKKHASENGYEVPNIKCIGDGEISSTAIRRLIGEGDFEKAGRRLGRPYEMMGIVIEGKRLAKTLGHPTANLDVEGLILPPKGVYAISASLPISVSGVMNIGFCPTFFENDPPPKPVVEVHFFDFDETLYGRFVEVCPIKFLRPERKFPSIKDLQNQIELDCRQAKEMSQMHEIQK